MELRENEKIKYTGKVMWYKKKLQAFGGDLTVTDQRMVFKQDKINAAGGLLGSLLASASKKTKGAVLLDEDLNNLSFSKGRSIGKKTFLLEVKNGGEQLDFQIDDEILAKTGISL